jgi:hypothetical protein
MAWDNETGYQGLSVFGVRMKNPAGEIAGTPSMVVLHLHDMKVQTFATGAAIGGIPEIRAAVEAALASAP